jgi:hypothetical protein
VTPESRKFAAADAKSLLDNKLFKDAFKQVGDYIESQALGCDPDNKEKAQRILISKQILAGIRREIERVVEDGIVAEIQLNEIEQRRKLFSFRR